jgi:hypothetical protein
MKPDQSHAAKRWHERWDWIKTFLLAIVVISALFWLARQVTA